MVLFPQIMKINQLNSPDNGLYKATDIHNYTCTCIAASFLTKVSALFFFMYKYLPLHNDQEVNWSIMTTVKVGKANHSIKTSICY